MILQPPGFPRMLTICPRGMDRTDSSMLITSFPGQPFLEAG